MIALAREEGRRRTVLIIDDELGPRESMRILLKNEFDVLCADSVDLGIALLQQHRPDLVVMDIRMPGKSGIQGLREIRSIDSEVSVVMLTGYGALETAQQAMRLGANDYLNKPFDTNEMRQAARKYTLRTEVERKRAAMLTQLQQINDRLLADAAKKEQLASMGQASAEFAHDVRNPLMIVSGYVELLAKQIEKSRDLMGETYDRASDYLDVIAQNIQRCCDLANTWRLMGKSQLQEMKPTPVSVLMDDIVMGVAPLAAAGGVQVDYDIRVNGAVVNVCRAQLLRALHNIVTNAIEAVPPRTGWIRIAARKQEDHVELTFKDNGCGMTPDVQARLFEPYFTTKAEGKGTGLGLVITRKIINEHRGNIDVQTMPGQGSTITVRLPLTQAAVAT